VPLSSEVGHLRLLLDVTRAANEAPTLKEALQQAIDAICRRADWPAGRAWLRSADTLGPALWRFPGGAALAEEREPPGRQVVERAVGRGRVEWEPDLPADWPLTTGSLHTASCIAVPVPADGEVVAVLVLFPGTRVEPEPAVEETLRQCAYQLGRAVGRFRTEEALRLSEATIAGMVSISSDAIISIDEDQRITFFNQGAEHIFGYTTAEILGRPLDVLIPERFRADHGGHVRDFGESPVAARRMGERGQIVGLRRNGEVFPADASISKQEVGGRRIYTSVLRDVTERYRSEEALSRQAAELARSNADLEQFAYVASHDLQEPLRMVASYTQLLARRYRGKLDEDADEFIGYVVDGVTRMQALINDLLAYSRVGTRGSGFDRVDVVRLVDRLLIDLGPAIEEADAVVVRGPLPAVHGDPVQLGQLFLNLLSNAIKFRGAQAPRVEVSAVRDGPMLRFSVSDNGIGIAPEFQDRIFVIFQRLHSRDEYPGTGIGLAICKKIVERHGGTIWLDSRPGAGTTFHFTLPPAEDPV
jgi:PAS domain S-box-containing protein